MSFRLWTIFYFFALVAAALATFGPAGSVVVAAVSIFWLAIYSKNQPKTAVESFVIVVVILFLILLILPQLEPGRESTRRGQCHSNLKSVALALLAYESKNGGLPPEAIADENGSALFSWRALILPMLERADVYESLDRAQVWDSPTNRAATLNQIDIFECPSEWPIPPPNSCCYFAVVGPHTMWPEGRSRRLNEITDPQSYTVLVIEAHGRNTPWAKPSDLTFDEAVQLLTDDVATQNMHTYRPSGGLFSQMLGKPGAGIHAAMADGTVHFLKLPLPKELAVALLTVDGNEGDLHDQLDYYTRPRIDIGKCYGFGVFVLLSLLPAVLLLRRRGPSAIKSADISP